MGGSLGKAVERELDRQLRDMLAAGNDGSSGSSSLAAVMLPSEVSTDLAIWYLFAMLHMTSDDDEKKTREERLRTGSIVKLVAAVPSEKDSATERLEVALERFASSGMVPSERWTIHAALNDRLATHIRAFEAAHTVWPNTVAFVRAVVRDVAKETLPLFLRAVKAAYQLEDDTDAQRNVLQASFDGRGREICATSSDRPEDDVPTAIEADERIEIAKSQLARIVSTYDVVHSGK